MTSEEFNQIANQLLRRCEDVLTNKADEYATEDRLHNFRIASQMQNINMMEALAGMMAKHTISIYDMCREGNVNSVALWDEKIIDHINYLILLRAIIEPPKKLDKISAPVPDQLLRVNPNNIFE